MYLPGCADIARSLQEDDAHITTDLPLMLATSPGISAETAMANMMSTWLQQDSMMGATFADMVIVSISLISLGPTPMAVDCPMATPEDVTDQESKD